MAGEFHSAVEAHREALAKIERAETAISALADKIVDCFRGSGKVLLCGNGGSATDADHLAAELVGRFQRDRDGWPAISLATSHAGLTAIANDYGYDEVFARQVRAIGCPKDVLIAITTSGNSENVYRAALAAKSKDLFVSAWTGERDGRVHTVADHEVRAPATVTARIQEMHILLGHILCEIVENRMVGH
jgi:D-sedoheptulose 7-phosphate isomerase